MISTSKTHKHVSILRVDGVLGTIEVPDFMPLGSNGRWSERVVCLPDCSFGPLVSKLGVVSTGKLKDTSVDIGSLLVNLETLPDIVRTYVLGGQDTDERCDEVGSETLEHLWGHGGSQHCSGGELRISCVGGRARQAYRNNDIDLDVVLCALSCQCASETDKTH